MKNGKLLERQLTDDAEKANLLSFRRAVRQVVADYMGSEGCSCCEGDDHHEHRGRLAKMLGVPKYTDGSGWDFPRFRTKEEKP